MSVLEQAEAKLIFDRVVNDTIMSGDVEENPEPLPWSGFLDLFEDSDEYHPLLTHVKWRKFDILHDQKTTRFVFTRVDGGSVERLQLVACNIDKLNRSVLKCLARPYLSDEA